VVGTLDGTRLVLLCSGLLVFFTSFRVRVRDQGAGA
jgi:hypothetical protein